MALGENIREQRKNAGMSQEKVAELLQISRQAVAKWEANKSAPSTENLIKLAQIFGTTVKSLMDNEDETDMSAAQQLLITY